MSRGKAMHQMSMQMELALNDPGGEAAVSKRSGEAGPTAHDRECPGAGDLMDRIVERSNLARAFKRVRQNQGSAGSDGMRVDELGPYLREHWVESLTSGSVRAGGVRFPSATRRNVYVRSKRAGERVMAMLARHYATLRLRINGEKSAVARVWSRKFLGYSFWVAKGRVVKYRVAPAALEELKQRVRQITCRSGGRSLTQVTRDLGLFLRGWKAYFQFAETPGIFAELDGWIHRRLRAMQLKQWKRGRTAFTALRARGLPEWLVVKGAGYARRWWWAAGLGAVHTALPGTYFERLGVPRLAASASTR